MLSSATKKSKSDLGNSLGKTFSSTRGLMPKVAPVYVLMRRSGSVISTISTSGSSPIDTLSGFVKVNPSVRLLLSTALSRTIKSRALYAAEFSAPRLTCALIRLVRSIFNERKGLNYSKKSGHDAAAGVLVYVESSRRKTTEKISSRFMS